MLKRIHRDMVIFKNYPLSTLMIEFIGTKSMQNNISI